VFDDVVSQHHAYTCSVIHQSSSVWYTALAWWSPVEVFNVCTPNGCLRPLKEATTGNLFTFVLPVNAGRSFPSQCITTISSLVKL